MSAAWTGGAMSDCDDIRPLIHAMFDGELDAANVARCEQHLQTCPLCANELKNTKALHQTLNTVPVKFTAPDHLRYRIDTMLNKHVRHQSAAQPNEMFNKVRSWLWPLTSFALVLCLAVMLSFQHFGSSRHELIMDEVVASHVRSLEENHLIDIENSSHHVIKPWFAGRLDYSPAVVDLSEKGFELVGARLDYVQHRKVAALVYRHGAHVINVFVWPNNEADKPPRLMIRQGYNVEYWDRSGMSYWAVSDMDADELAQFANAFNA
ncbi:MAG TPA: anti-sigma factor [Steroidobacteraceae bacterium]|nr:anti-sigma factor [Steroidobacteraceae bacterium]